MGLIHVPRVINWRRQAANNMSPSASFHRELVSAENHLSAFGAMREVYSKSLELGTDTGGATALGGRWRFRTGYGVTHVRVLMLMGLTSAATGAGSTANPISSVALTISGGATTTVTFAYGVNASTAITDAPDEHALMSERVAVTENTVYEGLLSNAGGARPLSIMVYEEGTSTVDESTSYMNTHSPTAGSPIFDADRERLLVGLSNFHSRNGGVCWHWSLYDGAARTRTSATPVNIIDNTETTTPTAASYGVYLDNTYHNRVSKTTVAYELAAYASISGGVTGTVRLIDTAGNVYPVSVTSASLAWVAATVNLPTAETFYAMQFFSDGVQTLTVTAISLIETG